MDYYNVTIKNNDAQWMYIENVYDFEGTNRFISYPISFSSECYIALHSACSNRNYSGTQWRVAGEMYATTLKITKSGCGVYAQSNEIALGY